MAAATRSSRFWPSWHSRAWRRTSSPAASPFVDKIKDLKAPDELKAAQSEFVSITEEQIAAAKANDGKKLESLQASSDAAGSKMGAPACANTGGG